MANIRDNFVKIAQKYVGTGCKIFNDYFGMPAGTPCVQNLYQNAQLMWG